jgi:hypothetical protein
MHHKNTEQAQHRTKGTHFRGTRILTPHTATNRHAESLACTFDWLLPSVMGCARRFKCPCTPKSLTALTSSKKKHMRMRTCSM